jgi:hypothetical protein
MDGQTTGIVSALIVVITFILEYIRRRWRDSDSHKKEIRGLRKSIKQALKDGRITEAAYLAHRLRELTPGRQVSFNTYTHLEGRGEHNIPSRDRGIKE